MKNGIILSKLSVIEAYLLKLNEYLPVSLERFKADWGLRKIFERSLQVMIEAMIDIGERIIAQKQMTAQKTAADTFKRLCDLGVIQDNETYIKMVRFRNLVVHNYDSIDPVILYDIIQKHLTDFKNFTDEIKNYENL